MTVSFTPLKKADDTTPSISSAVFLLSAGVDVVGEEGGAKMPGEEER